jgi:hypothetical protein
MVYDELDATVRRVRLVADNSSNPVEVFLATQVTDILGNVLVDVANTLANPGLEETAKEFYESIRASGKP